MGFRLIGRKRRDLRTKAWEEGYQIGGRWVLEKSGRPRSCGDGGESWAGARLEAGWAVPASCEKNPTLAQLIIAITFNFLRMVRNLGFYVKITSSSM